LGGWRQKESPAKNRHNKIESHEKQPWKTRPKKEIKEKSKKTPGNIKKKRESSGSQQETFKGRNSDTIPANSANKLAKNAERKSQSEEKRSQKQHGRGEGEDRKDGGVVSAEVWSSGRGVGGEGKLRNRKGGETGREGNASMCRLDCERGPEEKGGACVR